MRDTVQVEMSDAVSQLEALLTNASLSPKDTARCARLAEALQRPARLCLLGPDRALVAWLLTGFVGQELVAAARQPPALEARFGDALQTTATLDDGSTQTWPDLPPPEILARAPVFLQIEAPVAILRRMSVLAVSLDRDPAQHVPALAWAARRSEIAVWCTGRFAAEDAAIWSAAPQRLQDHAILVERSAAGASTCQPAAAEFVACFTAADGPRDSSGAARDLVSALQARLLADLDEARAADIDATRLFLHRLGHASTGRQAAGPHMATSALPADPAALRALVSEPLLYLMRRARTLAQALAWMEDDEPWDAEVLEECCETAGGLRDRTVDWPEDDSDTAALRRAIEEMGDTAFLLQVEGGRAAAETAAALLGQMRWEFEQVLARARAPETGVGR